MSDTFDCIVVGAGVVGLAIARQMAINGLETLILESEKTFGTGTSSRNSEVIHAGIYYPTNSLKARLCTAGRRQLYDYCQPHPIPHRRSGKLIVATNAEEEIALHKLQKQAQQNGVEDVTLIGKTLAQTWEPALSCTEALHSPSTGIIDSHAFMLSLLGDFETAGGLLALQSPVDAIHIENNRFSVTVNSSPPITLHTRYLINCAGLHAQDLARRCEGLPADTIPPIYYCKGNYYTLAGRSPFSRLIYPAPEAAGLGVHLTLDMGGQAKFGPDTQWIENIDYKVDPNRADRFYAAIRRYWKGLPDGALQPGYAGIRPKLKPEGAPNADFMIQDPTQHGIPGLVNCYGIESPGLSASLAIAQYIPPTLGVSNKI